jgi:phage tail-like protein
MPSYPAFAYVVDLTTADGTKSLGGFWQVNGLPATISATATSPGHSQGSSPRKILGLHKVGDIVLKRGVVDSAGLWDWIDAVRNGNTALANGTVQITLRDETRRRSSGGPCTRRNRSIGPAPPCRAKAAETWQWRN